MSRWLWVVLTVAAAACTESTPIEVSPPIVSNRGMWVSRWISDGSVSSATVEARDTSGAVLLAFSCRRPGVVETIRILDRAAFPVDNAPIAVEVEVQTVARAILGSDSARAGPVGEAWIAGASATTWIDRAGSGWHLHLRYSGVERTWGSLERMAELVATARSRCSGI